MSLRNNLIRRMAGPPVGALLVLLLSSSDGFPRGSEATSARRIPFQDLETITLEGFLDVVRERHPYFDQQALAAEIQRKAQESLLGDQDPVLTATPSFRRYESPFTGSTDNTLGATAGLSRTFWNTGGRLSARWGYDYVDRSNGSDGFHDHSIYLTYSHPLLRNRGGVLDRLEYEAYEYIVDYTEAEAHENQEKFLLDAAARFLDWVLLDAEIEIAYERLALAEEQLADVQERRRANLVDEVDVLRADDAVQAALQNIVLLETLWEGQQAQLAVMAQFPEILERAPFFDLYQTVEVPDEETAVRQIEEHSRTVRVLSLQRDHIASLEEGYREQLKHQLDAYLEAGLADREGKFINAALPGGEDVTVGVNFSLTFGKRTPRAEIERSQTVIRQYDSTIRNVSLGLEADLRNILKQIEGYERVLELNRRQIATAEKRTAEELRLYNLGRGQLVYVIQSRDNEQNANLNYARNAQQYHELMLYYREIVDELLAAGP